MVSVLRKVSIIPWFLPSWIPFFDSSLSGLIGFSIIYLWRVLNFLRSERLHSWFMLCCLCRWTITPPGVKFKEFFPLNLCCISPLSPGVKSCRGHDSLTLLFTHISCQNVCKILLFILAFQTHHWDTSICVGSFKWCYLLNNKP